MQHTPHSVFSVSSVVKNCNILLFKPRNTRNTQKAHAAHPTFRVFSVFSGLKLQHTAIQTTEYAEHTESPCSTRRIPCLQCLPWSKTATYCYSNHGIRGTHGKPMQHTPHSVFSVSSVVKNCNILLFKPRNTRNTQKAHATHPTFRVFSVFSGLKLQHTAIQTTEYAEHTESPCSTPHIPCLQCLQWSKTATYCYSNHGIRGTHRKPMQHTPHSVSSVSSVV